MILFIFIENQISMMMNNCQTYFDFFIEYTMYSNELKKLNLTISMIDIYLKCIMIDIFTNNQTIIKFFKNSKQ